MRRIALSFFFLPLIFLAACVPASLSTPPLPTPLFFYIRLAPAGGTGVAPAGGAGVSGSPTLVLTQNPESARPLREIPLTSPADCNFWSLTPAPVGPFAAIEWECSFGPVVQVLNVSTGKADFLSDDPTLDNRFLAWNPDGDALYLKAGTLSNPQVWRVQVKDLAASALPVSPNTYDLTVSPTGGTLLYSFSNGIGFGSESWLVEGAGQKQRQILSDAKNILGLFRYSPDGKRIAYIRLPDSQSAFPAGELWVMDSDGKNAHLAATADAGRGMPPVWSPDGTKIAFAGRTHSDDPDSVNLSIYDVSTSQLSTHFSSPVTAPVWSQDGLYFTQAENDTMDIWFYEITSGNAQKMISGACCAGWIH